MGIDNMTYVMTCILAAGTPGPGTLAVINMSIKSGLKKTLPLMVGIIIGLAAVALLSIYGLSIIMLSSTTVFHAIQSIGGMYIFYLGIVCILNFKTAKLEENEVKNFGVCSGVIISVFNPKTIIFFTSLMPTFINVSDNTVSQSFYLTAILLCCTFLVHLLYAKLGNLSAKVLNNHIDKLELATGIFFISIATFILYSALTTTY